MELEKINSILGKLNRSNPDLEFIKTEEIHMGVSGNSYGDEGGGVEGESDQTVDIFKIKSEEDLYLMVYKETDSYGDGSSITSVQFAEVTKQNKTVYKPVV